MNNSCQFYLKDDSMLINMNSIDTIIKTRDSVIISFVDKNKKSIVEKFDNENQVESYFLYIANAIYNKDQIISKSVFLKIIEKENEYD